MSVTWDGVTIRSDYAEAVVAERDELANAAHEADWDTVLKLLAGDAACRRVRSPNSTRIGGATGYSVLHQAAWHGADPDVVRRLIELGGWRTLRTFDGLRPVDIDEQRGHRHVVEILLPQFRQFISETDLRALQEQLHPLIRGRIAELVVAHQLRLPAASPRRL